jgi:hypothetical protein
LDFFEELPSDLFDSEDSLEVLFAINEVSEVVVTFGILQAPSTLLPILFGKGSYQDASFVSVSFFLLKSVSLFKRREIGFI